MDLTPALLSVIAGSIGVRAVWLRRTRTHPGRRFVLAAMAGALALWAMFWAVTAAGVLPLSVLRWSSRFVYIVTVATFWLMQEAIRAATD